MVVLQFLWAFLSLFTLASAGNNHSETLHWSHNLNKQGVTTIKSPDGDIIDCVIITNQPAFDHPLLDSSKLQISPSNAPAFKPLAASARASGTRIQQLWHQTGQRCPVGTIPIRRIINREALGVRKTTGPPNPTIPPLEEEVSVSSAGAPGIQHEHAIAYAQGFFYGAGASINVWDPSVEGSKEFSLSQLWLLSGTFNVDLNSLEAGWQVNPALYGDRNPRFFTYWTSDSYRSTGCYNLMCQGFIQINDQVVLGGSVAPVSSFNGAQYDIQVLVFKDFVTGNWWLRYGEELIGYWPGELFTHLRGFANVIEWGGEVVNTQPFNRHTSTQMGSGNWPQAGFQGASYVKNLQVMDLSSLLRIPPRIQTLSTRPDCYGIQASSYGAYFYGGPGLSSSCH